MVRGLAIFSLGVLYATTVGASTFPYEAYVILDGTPVRSGPGKTYYKTEELNKGTTVDVYHHIKGSWCAVRPPMGSFSWVRQNAVSTTQDPSIVRVTVEDAATHVGTRFSDAHNVRYISLKKGELLQYLGKSYFENSAGELQPWLKIAPPAGEFRWIEKKLLSSVPLSHVPQVAQDTMDREDGASEPVTPESVEHLDEDDDVHAAPADTESVAGQGSLDTDSGHLQKVHRRLQLEPIAASELNHAAEHHVLAGTTSILMNKAPSRPSRMNTVPIPEPTVAAPRSAHSQEVATESVVHASWVAVEENQNHGDFGEIPAATDADYASELRRIDLRLSQIVSENVATWQLAGLRQRAERVIDTSDQRQFRHKGREILRRISEFENVQRRFESLSERSAPPDVVVPESIDAVESFDADGSSIKLTTATGELPRNFSLPEAPPEPPARMTGSQALSFEGVLVPVLAKQRHADYALMAGDGSIVRFVAAEAGFDLREYVQKYVAVVGCQRDSRLIATKVVVLK